MKIIYFGYNSFESYKRGVENVIDFQSKACDFEIIYYFHWGDKSTVKKNNKFICISVKHYWLWPVVLNIILFRIKRKNKVFIHSHNPLFSLLTFYKTDIFTVHDGLYYLSKSRAEKISKIFLILEPLLYVRCRLVHFISDYTKSQALFWKKTKYVIIPNTSHIEVNQKYRVLPLKQTDVVKVLIVRSIEQRARIDLLIDVAEKLKNSKYFFEVAGKGPLLDFFRKRISEKGVTNISMLGYVSDDILQTLYLNCNIVLMIAEYGEGFGLPVIEGYLFNKPVVASNKCAIPEVIISPEFLFENDVESIIESLNNAMNATDVKFREYYDRKFSNSIVLEQFRNLYLKKL